MSGNGSGVIRGASGGGVIGEHPESPQVPYFVGPSTGSELNTLQLPLIPILCWKVEDIRFAFDSSFVTSTTDPLTNPADTTSDPLAKPSPTGDIRDELKLLANQIKRNPECPLSVFGHADPVGPAVDPDGYNKALSGRRATAIYAVLISCTQPGKAASLWQGIAESGKLGLQACPGDAGCDRPSRRHLDERSHLELLAETRPAGVPRPQSRPHQFSRPGRRSSRQRRLPGGAAASIRC